MTSRAFFGVLAVTLAFSALAPATIEANSAPPPPTFVKGVSVDALGVMLAWAPPVERPPIEAYSYRVYRSIDHSPFALLAETHLLSHADFAVPENVAVTYAIRTVDVDDVESAPAIYSGTNEGDGQCVQSSSSGANVRVQECIN